MRSTESFSQQLLQLKDEMEKADAIVIGAGAGMSSSAGFEYSGEHFRRYFWDFEEKYGFHDMYSGGFCLFDSPQEHWAYWSRFIFLNRYTDAPRFVYEKLHELVMEKDYFVVTTNVDHCFQKAGFRKDRLFYTQGDYGLIQCSTPCHRKTYDNEEMVRSMLKAQGYTVGEDGALHLVTAEEHQDRTSSPSMTVPTELIPLCPVCGEPMSMNLRADNTFVEDEGWHQAAGRYEKFLHGHEADRVLFLELGVGANTPMIIKYPFWRMTASNPKAVYACINMGEAFTPKEISDQSVCINGDIGEVLEMLE